MHSSNANLQNVQITLDGCLNNNKPATLEGQPKKKIDRSKDKKEWQKEWQKCHDKIT